MMIRMKTLRSRLMAAVCLIVSTTVLLCLGAGIYLENQRHRQGMLDTLYYKTMGMKQRMGHLLYGKNLRYLMINLKNARKADPDLLYAVIQDAAGRILLADDPAWLAMEVPPIATPLGPDLDYNGPQGLSLGGMAGFRVRESRLNLLLQGGGGDHGPGAPVFEVHSDITYLGNSLGVLRLGYSQQRVRSHLVGFGATVLITGIVVLLSTLLMLFLVIRRYLTPLDHFVAGLDGLNRSDSSQGLIRNLSCLDLKEGRGEVVEIRNLKQGFARIRDRFTSNWELLEDHRNNLEKMVTERTAELNRANGELNRQIQERKEIESRMLNIQKVEALGTLAGGIAHEFNNLFMAIMGNASLILARCEPGHANVQKAEKIKQLVDKGATAVQHLLGFARSGRYEAVSLDLNSVVRSSLAVFSRSRKDLKINTVYGEGLWRVVADPSQMEQVIMNLLLNASDAMPDQGQIWVFTENRDLDPGDDTTAHAPPGSYVCLSIVDAGPGIPPDILPRIFDPFFTTKRIGVGSGLGLASVYGIVENHSGMTRVESRPGHGAEFRIYLPASPIPEETFHEQSL